MAIGVYVFGHGGGVPMGDAGNTNFAVFPDIPADWSSHPDPQQALEKHPYWLIDCGPETVSKLCGQHPHWSTYNPLSMLQGVVITHCHADHSGGIPSLAWRLRFIEQKKVKLVIPRGCASMLAQQAAELEFNNPAGEKTTLWSHFDTMQLLDFNVHRLSDSIEAIAVPADHNLCFNPGPGLTGKFPAYAIDMIINSKRIVFSGDTATPMQDSPWTFPDVTAVFHDCQFYSEDTATAVHVPYPVLEAAVEPEYRSKMILAHTLIEPPAKAYAAGFSWAHKGRLFLF